MRTEQLIAMLAADGGAPRLPLGRRLAAALGAGFVVSAVVFLLTLGPRPDIAAAAGDARFVLKFVVTLALAVAAAGLALRLIRPGASAAAWGAALLIAPALLALGIGYELATVPAERLMPRLIGRNALLCLVSIPLLALPALVALLAIMRTGAPSRPGLAGAAAGLAAGALGATLYAAHCVDDSPLFVMAWYGTAVAAVTGVAALIAARWLRW